MSRESTTDFAYIVMGVATATSIGSFLFQAVGAVILGILGALGGYLFNRFLRHKIESFLKKSKEKNNEKAE
jgi:hypothetical protein